MQPSYYGLLARVAMKAMYMYYYSNGQGLHVTCYCTCTASCRVYMSSEIDTLSRSLYSHTMLASYHAYNVICRSNALHTMQKHTFSVMLI